MILSLTESLQSCKDELASCQSELESAKAEIDKWNSAFKKESFVPARKSPEPEFVIDYIQTLRSSEKSLKEEVVIWLISFVFFTSFFLQLEIAQMKVKVLISSLYNVHTYSMMFVIFFTKRPL
ncbi:FKBP12-interacting protein of 37 kDa-like isoform X1 [Raphanus sativus]|uniref:FKBP12-interacting protein of 37 kDa-like isoform X1 n=1 Tax=Raphanus sativus TaxID=3726 RepID=A0A9W3CCB5_RAPSA|nr:FKBP12-interacting protein of 37 kDa-like isoform X1 [Raphanus sativus]